MKFLTYAFSLILLCSLVACGGESAPKRAGAVKTAGKPIASAATKKKAKKTYWTQVQSALKLSKKQTEDLKKINIKYAKKINALPKASNGKRNPSQVSAINKQKQAEFKRFLGNSQYAKLQAFDAKSKKAKKGKSKKKGYWAKLKTGIKLSDAQLKNLKAVNTKYDKLMKAVPKSNKTKRKALNAQKQAEFKKVLGSNLYSKKVAFDRKMNKKK